MASKEDVIPKTASMADEWAVGALKPKEVPNKAPEFLSQLAKDIATNLVFTDRHIREFDMNLGMIFMPIALGAFGDTTEEYRKDIGLIYEYYDKAGPRGINGYPCFFSFCYVSKHDALIVWEKFEKIRKVLEDV